MAEELSEKAKKALIAESASVGATSFVKGHANTVTSCAISHGERFVASGGKDGVIYQCMS